jgi:hypothetical protein
MEGAVVGYFRVLPANPTAPSQEYRFRCCQLLACGGGGTTIGVASTSTASFSSDRIKRHLSLSQIASRYKRTKSARAPGSPASHCTICPPTDRAKNPKSTHSHSPARLPFHGMRSSSGGGQNGDRFLGHPFGRAMHSCRLWPQCGQVSKRQLGR